MLRSTFTPINQRRLVLLICWLAAATLSTLLALTTNAQPRLPQEISQLSPLPQTEISPLVPMPGSDLAPIPLQVTPEVVELGPLPAQPSADIQPEAERAPEDAPAELATPVTDPNGVEPLRAQLSLSLVGLIFVGLIGVVVLIIVRARRAA